MEIFHLNLSLNLELNEIQSKMIRMVVYYIVVMGILKCKYWINNIRKFTIFHEFRLNSEGLSARMAAHAFASTTLFSSAYTYYC